jgi:hypothetical protein
VPRVQHLISLYANITKIKWNYNAGDDMVNGFFVLPDENIDPISFHKHDLTEMEVADNLWKRVPGANDSY